MESSFNVCTYNIGFSSGDYQRLVLHHQPSFGISSKEAEDCFLEKYDKVQGISAEILVNQAQAFCLQEVAEISRPIIKSLVDRGFQIIHIKENFDTAIALDTKRFSHITNHSMLVKLDEYVSKDVAIATAIDIKSGQHVAFVSAHVPGFEFSRICDKETREGDIYCESIAQKLSEIANGTIQIVCADMNANPETWMPRFETFSKKGFQILRTNTSTNVNPKALTDQEREIDFIFATTSSIWQTLKSFFVKTCITTASVIANDFLGLDPENNASDHIPVFAKVSFTVNTSKISQLWNSIYLIMARRIDTLTQYYYSHSKATQVKQKTEELAHIEKQNSKEAEHTKLDLHEI